MPDSLAPESRLSACARPSPISNLSLLAMNETGALLGSDACGVSEVLKDLKRDFGFIVVDLPHVESGLCFALAGMLDGVLLVVESHRTAEEAAARARQRLLHANASSTSTPRYIVRITWKPICRYKSTAAAFGAVTSR